MQWIFWDDVSVQKSLKDHSLIRSAVTSRKILCLLRTVFETSRKGNWWPDQVFKEYVVVYAISIMNGRWLRLLLFDSFSKRHFNRCKVDVIAGDANAAAYKIFTKSRTTKICTILQLPWCWERCNVRLIWDAHLRQTSFLLHYQWSLFSASLSRRSWLLLHGCSLMEKTTWTQNYEKTLEQLAWANTG